MDASVSKGLVGTIGGGKARPTGRVDIAVMQSLSRQGEVNALVENYGQVIVDECHHVVLPRSRESRIDLPTTAGIQDVFRHLVHDLARTETIAAEITRALKQGRKVLVLTERTEHLDAIHLALAGRVPPPFVLHGRMSKKQRAALIAELDALAPQAPRILLAAYFSDRGRPFQSDRGR